MRFYSLGKRRVLGALLLPGAVLCGFAITASLPAQDTAADKANDKAIEKLAPYYPTPEIIVDKMLQFGGLKAGEKMFDLGSGDGRIVIMAARKYKADATGVEFDDGLVKQSTEKIKTLGLAPNAHIIHGDLLKQNYASADLITVYLLPVGNDKLSPILKNN